MDLCERYNKYQCCDGSKRKKLVELGYTLSRLLNVIHKKDVNMKVHVSNDERTEYDEA